MSYDARDAVVRHREQTLIQRGGDHGAYRLRTFEGVEPMGRGRAKAKQVKVARQLKYKSSDGSDLDRLRAELVVGADSGDGEYDSAAGEYDDDEDDEDDDEDDPRDAWKDPGDGWR
jgi:hypothetical protein